MGSCVQQLEKCLTSAIANWRSGFHRCVFPPRCSQGTNRHTAYDLPQTCNQCLETGLKSGFIFDHGVETVDVLMVRASVAGSRELKAKSANVEFRANLSPSCPTPRSYPDVTVRKTAGSRPPQHSTAVDRWKPAIFPLSGTLCIPEYGGLVPVREYEHERQKSRPGKKGSGSSRSEN